MYVPLLSHHDLLVLSGGITHIKHVSKDAFLTLYINAKETVTVKMIVVAPGSQVTDTEIPFSVV